VDDEEVAVKGAEQQIPTDIVLRAFRCDDFSADACFRVKNVSISEQPRHCFTERLASWRVEMLEIRSNELLGDINT
jgi:hypothetical protein